MKRRQLIRYAGASLLSSITVAGGWQTAQAQPRPVGSGNLAIQWLGHTCFLISGNGLRVLINPFRALGCTAGYRLPQVAADLVLASSLLFDEGAVDTIPSGTRILTEPGLYQLPGAQLQGIGVVKDRLGGRRFGRNVAWSWTQAGINILHLGALASPIEPEQKILMGRPNVLLIPVGGGAKSYTSQEAIAAIKVLEPKIIVPTHFRTQAADPAPDKCDIVAVDQFLQDILKEPTIQATIQQNSGDTINLTSASLPRQGSIVIVPNYSFS